MSEQNSAPAAPSPEETTLRLAGVIRESIVDGPGIRMVVFGQGCPHHCEGCQNPGTHPFDGGYFTTVGNLLAAAKKNPLLKGLTLSGGDPFVQAHEFSVLAHQARALGYDIVTFTGYTYEQLIAGGNAHPEWLELLRESDLLIDGRFELKKKSLLCRFRGSTNQRVIDVPASLEKGEAVLHPDYL